MTLLGQAAIEVMVVGNRWSGMRLLSDGGGTPSLVLYACQTATVPFVRGFNFFLMRRPITRSKGKALARARKQLQEGDEELTKLLAQASELDLTAHTTEDRIIELQVGVLCTAPHRRNAGKNCRELLSQPRFCCTVPPSRTQHDAIADLTARSKNRSRRRHKKVGSFGPP